MYLFRPMACELKRACEPSAERFLRDFCKVLCHVKTKPRAGAFRIQKYLIGKSVPNTACVLETVNDNTFCTTTSVCSFSFVRTESTGEVAQLLGQSFLCWLSFYLVFIRQLSIPEISVKIVTETER